MLKIAAIAWLVTLLAGGGIYLIQAKNGTLNNHPHSMSHTAPQSLEEETDLINQENVVVTMKGFEYYPPVIKIKKGTTVTWVNEDQMEHNAMKDHNETEAHEHSDVSDDETGGFNSPMLATGESWSFTFDEEGTIPYHCAPHPYMKGSIEVIE